MAAKDKYHQQDKLKRYENIIVGTLKEYAEMFNQQRDGLEATVLIDKDGHHYQLLNSGWLRACLKI